MSEGGKSQDALDRWRAHSAQSGGQEGGKDGDDASPDKDGSRRRTESRASPVSISPFWFKIAMVVIVIVLLIGLTLWWLDARQYEDTDDAFIDTHIVHIAPQISGQIHHPARERQSAGEAAANCWRRSIPQDTQAKLAQAQAQGLAG